MVSQLGTDVSYSLLPILCSLPYRILDCEESLQ